MIHQTAVQCCFLSLALSGAFALISASSAAANWPRHTIDNTSQGADGVRLADVNGDGRLDIATGWEEGGVVRIYVCPEPDSVRKPWPMTEVATVAAPEDAVFADVDADGHLDVVSCCEGKIKAVFVHWNPGHLQNGAWTTNAFPQLQGRLPWMFCLPMFDAQQQVSELVIGSKGGTGEIGLLIPPKLELRRDVSQWTWQQLGKAGWVMSIQSEDMDGDGLIDIVYSDRRESTRGIHWLKRPGQRSEPWAHSTLGGQDREVMFMDIADVNKDGRYTIVSAAKHPSMLLLKQDAEVNQSWRSFEVPYPPDIGTGKGVAIGDIDGDGVPDLVCTCENAKARSGVYWLSHSTDQLADRWQFHDISGPDEGIKFDRLELIDLDNDGDLDVLTCEERDGLGVIWYENRR